jgi:hypothetical protein
MDNKAKPIPKPKPPSPPAAPVAPADKKSKFRQESEAAKPSSKLRDKPSSETSSQLDPKLKGKGKPKTKAEKAASKENKQFDKSRLRAEKTGAKLDNARDKLAKQKPYKPPGVSERLTRAAGFEVAAQVHRKIHEVESDNVGLEAAHRAEIFGEHAGRSAVRRVKRRIHTRPARQVRKMEKIHMKANADYHFRELAMENPELNRNAIKRHLHKKRIQKQMQKQAQEAAKKGATKAAKESASLVGKAGRAVVDFVKTHPKAALILALCFLLIVIIQSCTAMSLSLFNGLGGGVIGGTTFVSEDADMLGAEAAYAGMESGLQYRLDNYAALNPGYHEYHYSLDEIGHDPYVLISTLSAFHDGPWTLGEVQGIMATLFERQYILTETVTVETRYYTEYWSYTDPETGETSSGSYEVPYDYYICTVTLENFNLSHLPIYIMGEEQLSRYSLYMATLGNRPDLFPAHLYPHASTYKSYEIYDIPQEYLDADPVFAAMVAVANSQCGKPYVWGGYSPQTSFDCSGFVSFILNSCGWNIGRLGAQGLYNICTPVSSADARPGDLVFFKGTYAAPDPNGVTHVALYVGDGMVVHAGDPIGYTSINTSYWQSHFFAYGRP